MKARRTSDQDPRDIVTERAFQVNPALLGRPLASPRRRLAAILVDLTLVGVIVLFKEISGSLFALAVAWIMWRVADPDVDVYLKQRWLRRLLKVSAVITFLVGVTTFLSTVVPAVIPGGGSSASSDTSGAPAAVGPLPSEMVETVNRELPGIGLRDVAGLTTNLIRLSNASTLEVAHRTARGASLALHRTGLEREEIEEAIRETAEEAAEGTAWEDSVDVVVRGAMARVDSARTQQSMEADSLLDELVAAAVANDTARVQALRPQVIDAASETNTQLLLDRLETLEDRLDDRREPPGIVAILRQIMDDLGLGAIWLALYFTAFLHLWQGHTPGKRLLGLRVVKVNGTEIGWWDSFTRFGGYAAGFSTGLLGFAQVFWDANRQGLHDRIAGTLVIQE